MHLLRKNANKKGDDSMQTAHSHDQTSWYAVSTRSRHEKVAASLLESRGISHFLPLTRESRSWSDRKQTVEIPLFPGYLFVHIPRNRSSHTCVLSVPGVVRIIGNQAGPQPIPDDQIEGIHLVLSHGVPCVPHRFFNVGDRVRVITGVLAGLEGTLCRVGSDSKLVLSIAMIQQSVAITIQRKDVVPVTESAPSFRMSA